MMHEYREFVFHQASNFLRQKASLWKNCIYEFCGNATYVVYYRTLDGQCFELSSKNTILANL